MAIRKKRNGNVPTAFNSPFEFESTPAPGQENAASLDKEKASVNDALFAGKEDPEIDPDYGHKRLTFRKHDEVSIYNAHMQERYAMDPRKRNIIIIFVIAFVLIPLNLILPTHLLYGGSGASIAQIGASVGGHISAIGQLGADTAAGMAMRILLWQVLAVFVAGAGLALNGAVYQGTLKNALASPSTLGVMSGATLGSVFYTLVVLMPSDEVRLTLVQASELTSYLDTLGPLEYFIMTQARVLCSLAGCTIIAILVLFIAFIAGRGRVSKVGLLVSGQVFTAIINSIVEMVRFYIMQNGSDAQMQAIRNAVGGSFETFTDPMQLLCLGIPVLIGIIIVLALRNRLNLLAFDDEEAKSMGISVNATRNAVIIVCTVLSAVIVAYVGNVGFVGFLVPHIARKMVGPDFRYFIPASLGLGASYLLVTYYLMSLVGILQGSIGTFTSIIGVVFFIIIAVQQRARGNVDWI